MTAAGGSRSIVERAIGESSGASAHCDGSADGGLGLCPVCPTQVLRPDGPRSVNRIVGTRDGIGNGLVQQVRPASVQIWAWVRPELQIRTLSMAPSRGSSKAGLVSRRLMGSVLAVSAVPVEALLATGMPSR